MNQYSRQSLVIGFAMFALVCGAGNIIFPTTLGVSSGSNWGISSFGFLLSDVVLSVITMLILNKKGSLEKMGEKIGIRFIRIFTLLFMLIVLFIFVPRGAAISYELGVIPIIKINQYIFYTIYFATAILFCLRPSKVFDFIGRWMSPVLFSFLIYIIIKSMMTGHNYYQDPSCTSFETFQYGFFEGYQTGDSLGAMPPINLAISILILKGYHNLKERQSIIFRSIFIFGALLSITYIGLSYLGASVSANISSKLSSTEILSQVFFLQMGHLGVVCLSIILFFACFSTTVGVNGFTADFFSQTYRVNYRIFLVIASILNIIIASYGVDKIIQFAGPILNIMYTAFILLIILSIMQIQKSIVFKVVIYTGLTVTILDTLSQLGIHFLVPIIKIIPWSQDGFAWVVPSLTAFIISYLLPSK